MEMYRYDENTFEYLFPDLCQQDPLNPEVLFPIENALWVVPPETLKYQVAVADPESKTWLIEEDYRGETAYSKTDKSELEITQIGPIPDTHSLSKPGEFDEWSEVKQRWLYKPDLERRAKAAHEKGWAMFELALTDRCLTSDFPITEEGRQQITTYRARLRNPARSNHPCFPEKDWRPEWPESVKRPAV